MTIPYSFSAGQKAKSAEVNANFTFLLNKSNTDTQNLNTSIDGVRNTANYVSTTVNEQMVKHSNNTAVGNSTTPVYVASDGTTTVCSRAIGSGDLRNSSKTTTKATTASSANNTSHPVIIANYKNGNGWYRKWSDGWIEQGGYFASGSGNTLNFLINFTTTSYFINANSPHVSTLAYEPTVMIKASSRETSYCKFGRSSSGDNQGDFGFFWIAFGY